MNQLIYKPIEDVKSILPQKTISNVFVVCIMALLVMLIYSTIGEVFAALIAKLMGITSANSGLNMILSLILSFGFMMLGVFAWVRKKEKRKIETLGLYKRNAIRNYMDGILAGIIMYTLVMIILYITGNAKIVFNSSTQTGLSALPFVLLIIPGWIIQSAAEEILTRGWLLSSIGGRYNLKLGIIVSSLFFAGLHLLNSGITMIAVVNLVLISLVFVVVSLYYGDIWAACGLHFSWNFFQGNIFGCPVSGQIPGGASLIQTELVGNELLTGGTFGPEAGLVATVIILVTIAFIGLKVMQKNNLLGEVND